MKTRVDYRKQNTDWQKYILIILFHCEKVSKPEIILIPSARRRTNENVTQTACVRLHSTCTLTTETLRLGKLDRAIFCAESLVSQLTPLQLELGTLSVLAGLTEIFVVLSAWFPLTTIDTHWRLPKAVVHLTDAVVHVAYDLEGDGRKRKVWRVD